MRVVRVSTINQRHLSVMNPYFALHNFSMIVVVLEQIADHHKLRKTQRIAGHIKYFPHFCEVDTSSASPWFTGQGSATC